MAAAALALQALRDYLTNVLQIPDPAARALIHLGGLTSFDDCIMRDDAAETIIKNCWKLYRPPRPLVPAGGGAGDVDIEDVPAQPGVGAIVTNRDSERFRQLAFYCIYMDRVDRAFVAADATLACLRTLWDWRTLDKEQAKMDVKDPDELTKLADTRKAIEELERFLRRKRGVTGTPLAYLIREHEVPVAANDPGFGRPNFTAELIARARHGDYPDYTIDNQFLWSVIDKMTQKGFAWTWVKDQARDADGRKAFQQLKAHFLGDSFMGKVKSEADKVLENTFYDGKA
jgi:hypothetical protein